MRWRVIRKYEQGRLARAHEIARHGQHEVDITVHAGEELLDHVHRQVRAAGDELRRPVGEIVLQEVPR